MADMDGESSAWADEARRSRVEDRTAYGGAKAGAAGVAAAMAEAEAARTGGAGARSGSRYGLIG